MWENLTSIIVAVNVLFGQPGAPLMTGVLVIAIIGSFAVGGPILYWIWKPDKNAKLAKAIRLGHVGGEGEEDNNPAMADTMVVQPKLRRQISVQTRVTPLPRCRFYGTARKHGKRLAIFTTGRRTRSEGKIVREGRYGHYLVEKSGNHMWVTE